MGLGVLVEVIAAHKTLLADVALEPFLPRVGAVVSLELVGPREALPAERPGAVEGPLPRVPAKVGPEVGRLPVDLPAVRVVADVPLLLGGAVGVLGADVDAHGAVRAGAGHAFDSFGLDGKGVDDVAVGGGLDDCAPLPLRGREVDQLVGALAYWTNGKWSRYFFFMHDNNSSTEKYNNV